MAECPFKWLIAHRRERTTDELDQLGPILARELSDLVDSTDPLQLFPTKGVKLREKLLRLQVSFDAIEESLLVAADGIAPLGTDVFQVVHLSHRYRTHGQPPDDRNSVWGVGGHSWVYRPIFHLELGVGWRAAMARNRRHGHCKQ